MPTLAAYQASQAPDAAPSLAKQQPEPGTEFCANGKHYIKDNDQFVEVGDCEEPKHQVVNAAQQAAQAAQGQPQEGAAVDSQGASQMAPSQLINQLLGTGDKKALF